MYYENHASRGTLLKRRSTRHVSEITAIASEFGNSAKIIVPRSWCNNQYAAHRLVAVTSEIHGKGLDDDGVLS